MKKNHIIIGLFFVAAMMISAKTITPVLIITKQLHEPGTNRSGLIEQTIPADTHLLLVSSLLETDAAIGSIVEPASGSICSASITPGITIRNVGTETLNSVEVGMILDGSPLGTITTFNNLSLVTSAESPVLTLLPDFAPEAGLHVLKVYTRNPNGNADISSGNDTVAVTFRTTPTLPLTYKESFESETFPPANGSAVINENAGSTTWTRTTDAGKLGVASMTLNAFNYMEVGERDTYRTPKIDVRQLDSVVVFFSVAYKEYEGAADSLLILYSPDCGITWLRTGYAKGGPDLSSSPGTTPDEFIPTTSEWRIESVVLKDLCAMESVMIGFQSYNGYGNNIYVDAINIAGFASSLRNIVLTSIDEPKLAECTNSLSPAVRFINTGLDTIHSLKINYQVDGGVITTFNWTGSLTRCNIATAVLATAVSSPGTHVLTVFTSEPNDLNDLATSNDTLRKTVTIYNATPIPDPVFEGFETAGITGWGIQNPDGGRTWERTVTTAKTGVASLWINNPAADNVNSAIDNFISPVVASSAAVDSMFVSWDYAYKSGGHYPGSTVLPLDTLEILVTNDCGATFTSVWKKWGEDLQTVNDPNYPSSTAFVPNGPAEWKSGRVYLSPFITPGGFQVYFSSKSNKQNNIWLDNIDITSKILPQRLKDQGYLIYPNPFGNSFLVHHLYAPVELQAMQVFNSTGQLVWDNRYNGNANTEVNIDLGNLAKGIYILKMIYSNKTVVERIVKH
ncbi:MAG: T9SS type A sorting domain-containing protein [Ferruginibacter sp.]